MTLLRYLPRFRRAYRELEVLAGRENWSRTEIEAFQLERLNGVWQHAVAHVPHYRRMAATNSLPARFSSVSEFLATVPILPKELVRAHPNEFLSERATPGKWHRTSGSTGTPAEFFWGQEAHCEVLRCRYRMHASWGVDIFDRCAFLWGRAATFRPGLRGKVLRCRQIAEDWLRNRLRLSAYHLGRDDLRGYLHRLADFRPASIYAFSTPAYMLALEAENTGCRCDSLKFVCLTSEPAQPHMLTTVERAFGVPAVMEYGSTECGFLAGHGPDRTFRVREDVAILETLPRADGRFDLVVTMLTNPSFPLLRYAIADVTDAPLQSSPRGFSILKNIGGRENDLIVTRSGRPVHPSRLTALFEFECEKAVRRYRVEQHADGSVDVLVEPNDTCLAPDTLDLERKLTDLTEGFPARVEVVPAVPSTAAGKHRWIVSDFGLLSGGGPKPPPLIPREESRA